MKEIEMLTKELDSLMGETAPEKRKRFDEVIARLKELNGPEVKEKMKPVIEHQLELAREDGELVKEVLRKRMNEKVYKLTPWGYIAKEYFGKSAGWLSQRINGTPVRGQVYTLSAEQKETLNRALQEVGTLIGSYRFA
jgi:hypothetical protein